MIHKLTEAEREESRAELRKILQGQHEILTLAEYRGMTAFVRVFIVKNNQLVDLTWQAAVALGEKSAHLPSQPYGLKRSGYGYSKEFDVVYNIGRVLYPKGYNHTAKNCHSNDHANGWDGVSKHNDGGYRFKQRSI